MGIQRTNLGKTRYRHRTRLHIALMHLAHLLDSAVFFGSLTVCTSDLYHYVLMGGGGGPFFNWLEPEDDY